MSRSQGGGHNPGRRQSHGSYGLSPANLAVSIGERLRRLGWSISTAESCTGGAVGYRLTTVPGSSDYFVGGVIAYSNEVKRKLLQVPEETLIRDGAVSESCAKAMAEGARTLFSSDVSVSITGIAGPDGGTEQKPVGLVFIGLATAAKAGVRRFRFEGSRAGIREAATEAALAWLEEELRGLHNDTEVAER